MRRPKRFPVMSFVFGCNLIFLFFISTFLVQAQGVSVTWLPVPQFFNSVGQPCAGCQIFTYAAGTNTFQASYTDSTGIVPNADPLTLDSTGKPASGIWLTSSGYKIVLEDSGGSIQFVFDNVIFGAATAMTAFSALTPSTNSYAGNFIASGNTWNFNAATLLAPLSAGYTTSTNSAFGYDSTANKWVFGQNLGPVSFGLASSGACAGSNWVSTPATATAVAICTQPAASDLSNGTTGSGAVVLATGATGVTLSSLTVDGMTWNGPSNSINDGLSNGTGLQHVRLPTSCSIPSTQFLDCTGSISWGISFADTNYTVTCQMVGASVDEFSLVLDTKTTSGFSYTIGNMNGGGSSTVEIDCIGIHD